MKFVLACIILLTTGGCFDSKVEPEDTKLGKEFLINHEQTVKVTEELSVTFSSFEESRCPEGVQCVRAGELFATLQLNGKDAEPQVSATFCVAGECLTNNSFSQRVIYYSGDNILVGETAYTIVIQDFTPQKSTQSAQANLYKLSLLISNK